MNKLIIRAALLFALIAVGCGNDPEVISSTDSSGNSKQSTGIFDAPAGTSDGAQARSAPNVDMHEVVVKEVLPTEKYVYLHVMEGEESFWIATRNQKVEVGATYFYRGGLLKTNFESKEYNRIFEKVYLVSNIVAANHGNQDGEVKSSPSVNAMPAASINKKNIVHDGSIRIGDLVDNGSKYAGKVVQITGECVKINYNIMGRNWIHLKDGSRDDFDMVITSDVQIPEGHVVTMQGTVSLNKDFGSGYRYEIIIEEGQMVHN